MFTMSTQCTLSGNDWPGQTATLLCKLPLNKLTILGMDLATLCDNLSTMHMGPHCDYISLFSCNPPLHGYPLPITLHPFISF